MALSANTERAYSLGDINDLPAAASVIYKGSAVSVNSSGYARALNTSDGFFAGFALQKVDNSAGSAGDLNVPVRRRGIVQLAITSAAITDVDKRVYASDDATFTFTQGSNIPIGTVVRWISTGVVEVEFAATGAGGASNITSLTDSTSGTANTTLTAATLTQATLTDSTGGSASTTLAALTNTDSLTNSTSGTADDTLTAVTDTSMSDQSGTINNNFTEIADQLATQRSFNTAVQNALASIAARLAEVKTDVAAVDTNTDNNAADLAAKVNELIAAL